MCTVCIGLRNTNWADGASRSLWDLCPAWIHFQQTAAHSTGQEFRTEVELRNEISALWKQVKGHTNSHPLLQGVFLSLNRRFSFKVIRVQSMIQTQRSRHNRFEKSKPQTESHFKPKQRKKTFNNINDHAQKCLSLRWSLFVSGPVFVSLLESHKIPRTAMS